MTPQSPGTGHAVTVKLAGTECRFETGRIARQAAGAVLASSGDNVVLATVSAAQSPRAGADFFPLTVEYREKMAAAGRIPGGFQRREGRIRDHEVLVSRLIDRTIRSLFPDHYRREVQVQVQVLSAEPTFDVVSLGLMAAAAALHVSPVPARGPAGGLRLSLADDAWVPFPSEAQRQDAALTFTVGAGPDGLVMVEGEAREVAEDRCASALEQAATWIGRFQGAFDELREAQGSPKWAVDEPPELPVLPDPVRDALELALKQTGKQARQEGLASALDTWLEGVEEERHDECRKAFAVARYEATREAILAEGRRLDGRGPEDIRPIWSETGILPRAHGSAVFTRGETQAIVTCTLGSAEDSQMLEGLGGQTFDRFLLHYNFPPYSVGEVRPLRGPGRREIGHGNLARRGLQAVMPDPQDHPYTVRVESEITESNGSSSMATACGATLAMLHAGVPLRRPVAGIAMGLVTDGRRHAVLSDILGDEDHLGDMDFKVVGTEQGVTALQLDNKVGGLPMELLHRALEQARAGRLHILDEMAGTIDRPNPEPSRFAPKVERTAIMPEAIGALVGARGANIKGITEATGAKVTVEDSGEVLVYATDSRSARKAMAMVQRSAGVLRVGSCYRGTVTSVKDFGVFVRVNQVNEGLVPAEELDAGPVRRTGDIAREGEEMVVSVLGADDRGRLRLSRKAALGVPDDQIVF